MPFDVQLYRQQLCRGFFSYYPKYFSLGGGGSSEEILNSNGNTFYIWIINYNDGMIFLLINIIAYYFSFVALFKSFCVHKLDGSACCHLKATATVACIS
jgi:hypothetical protein